MPQVQRLPRRELLRDPEGNFVGIFEASVRGNAGSASSSSSYSSTMFLPRAQRCTRSAARCDPPSWPTDPPTATLTGLTALPHGPSRAAEFCGFNGLAEGFESLLVPQPACAPNLLKTRRTPRRPSRRRSWRVRHVPTSPGSEGVYLAERDFRSVARTVDALMESNRLPQESRNLLALGILKGRPR